MLICVPNANPAIMKEERNKKYKNKTNIYDPFTFFHCQFVNLNCVLCDLIGRIKKI